MHRRLLTLLRLSNFDSFPSFFKYFNDWMSFIFISTYCTYYLLRCFSSFPPLFSLPLFSFLLILLSQLFSSSYYFFSLFLPPSYLYLCSVLVVLNIEQIFSNYSQTFSFRFLTLLSFLSYPILRLYFLPPLFVNNL